MHPFGFRWALTQNLAHSLSDASPGKVTIDIVLPEQNIGTYSGDERRIVAVLRDERAGDMPDLGITLTLHSSPSKAEQNSSETPRGTVSS
jgi:hypothetical protein